MFGCFLTIVYSIKTNDLPKFHKEVSAFGEGFYSLEISVFTSGSESQDKFIL
jgi:hypothetical protein